MRSFKALGGKLAALRGDISGPLTTALVSVPVETNYGIIAFAALGPSYVAFGILAAITTSVAANIAAVLAGSRPGMVGGTLGTLALAIAVLVSDLAGKFRVDGTPDGPLIITLTMLTVMMAGTLQVAMGAARVGRVFKYIPYPVLAGFVNSAATLIFLSALRPFVGLPTSQSLRGLVDDLSTARPGAVIVGLITVVVALRPFKFTRGIPPLLAAIIAGTFTHYLLATAFGDGNVGATLGAVSPRPPDLRTVSEFARIFADPELRTIVPTLLPWAISLALLATVQSLPTAAVLDGMLNTRHKADRELLAQGAANMLSSLFGGMPSAAGVSRCASNVRSGARTRWSALVYAGVAATIFAGSDYMRFVPLPMMGGLLIAVSWSMLDEWTRRVPLQLFAHRGLTRSQQKSLFSNYLVMILVVLTAHISNLITAVFVGILLAMFLFVRRNSRNIIRRELHCDKHHSRRCRSISRMRELEREGRRIILFELEGAIFFGTADQLARETERVANKADYLILDFRHVTEIDVTGARILQQAARHAANRRCQMLLANLQQGGGRARMLAATGISAIVDWKYSFENADAALEWAEDRLLETFDLAEPAERTLHITETQLGRGLSAGELGILEKSVEEHRFSLGTPIFRAGDDADGLYVVVRGSVSISLGTHRGVRHRLVSFGAGVILGELGLLDGGPRSADALADGDVTVFKLSRATFEQLREQHPHLAAKILFNLGVEMANRMRYMNREFEQELAGQTLRA